MTIRQDDKGQRGGRASRRRSLPVILPLFLLPLAVVAEGDGTAPVDPASLICDKKVVCYMPLLTSENGPSGILPGGAGAVRGEAARRTTAQGGAFQGGIGESNQQGTAAGENAG